VEQVVGQMSLFSMLEPKPVSVAPVVVSITETIEVRPSRVAHVIKDPVQWGWEELRDYVVSQIEALWGPFPRELAKEKSIFSSFIDRFGAHAPVIAKYAFEVKKGVWGGAPIRVTRFTRASDEWFARRVLDELAALER